MKKIIQKSSKLKPSKRRYITFAIVFVFAGLFGFIGYSLLRDSDAASNRGAAYDGFGLYIGGSVPGFLAREQELGREIKYVQLNGGASDTDYCFLIYDANCQGGDIYWGKGGKYDIGSRVTPMYGMHLFTGGACYSDGCNDAKYQASINGNNDSNYRLLADRLVAAGLTDTILRPSWEMNCSCGDGTNNYALYKGAWQRFHNLIKTEYIDTGKANFKFYFNPIMASGWKNWYPGSQYVDIIGFDIYDGIWKAEPKASGVASNPWADPAGVWNAYFLPSLEDLKNFAVSNGDQIGVGEWAVAAGGCNNLNNGGTLCPGSFFLSDPSKSGVDNPVFVQKMYDWHSALPDNGSSSLAFLIYFTGNYSHSGPHDYNTKNNGQYFYPNSRAKVLSLFGGSSTSTPPPTPPPPSAQADLTITNVTWSPANPKPGQPVTFSATIKNEGTTATPAVIHGVRFDINGGSTWSDNSVTSLAAGTSQTVTANGGFAGATWVPVNAGSFQVTAIVDDVDRITDEANEDNNTKVATVTVSQAQRAEDINQDGQVNLQDFSLLAANFGKSSGLTNPRVDINQDGIVNLQDFSLLAGSFGT